MDLPQFFTLEASSPEENAYPIAVAWSLPDGSLKTTTICPDEDWDPLDNHDHNVDLDVLFDQGASPADICLEMNSDLDGCSAFCNFGNYDNELLEKLYESARSEPNFEVEHWQSAFQGLNADDIEHRFVFKCRELDLYPETSEDRVRVMVFVAADELTT
jgi:hypothetical protein